MGRRDSQRVVVIGAGVGGLTAGALLLKKGFEVTVLEAQVYPGGCAGTYAYKGYRFDAGATLAGGFSPGGPHHRVAELLGLEWPIRPADPAWAVHLPNGRSVVQWADPERWQAERVAAFPFAEKFWKTQELLADISWDISSRPFPWPPESLRDLVQLGLAVRPKTLLSAPYLLRSIGSIAPTDDLMFKTFLDAQLLISAQTTSEEASALYGSAALDLPRRGVNHIEGGIGSLAQTLADWIDANGGRVLYREEAVAIEQTAGRARRVLTRKGERIEADVVLANLTPWGAYRLLSGEKPERLEDEIEARGPTWGAFMVYLGIDREKFAARFPGAHSHNQVVVDPTKPLGETNSVFFSMADWEDESRAPAGKIPVTMSTHTEVSSWFKLRAESEAAYQERKARYIDCMLQGMEQVLPGLRETIELQMGGTPVSFQQWTKRPLGMVGGFPQTSIFKARGPRTGIPNVLLVGDSIFPGQSTAGVTLGGLRVAGQVLAGV